MSSLRARTLLILGVCLAAVPLLGGGPDCPPPCFTENAPCAIKCGGAEDEGTCKINSAQALYCDPNDPPPPVPPDDPNG
jgi:hypothetical protein